MEFFILSIALKKQTLLGRKGQKTGCQVQFEHIKDTFNRTAVHFGLHVGLWCHEINIH